MKRIYTLLAVFLLAGCLFPTTRSIRGIIQPYSTFTTTGPSRSFDALQLQNYLRDDAPVFVEFGVDSCFVADFTRDDERYLVEIFSFLTLKGALGMFFITDISDAKPYRLGYFARTNESVIQFVKGHYLVSVTTSGNATVEGARELASGFEQRIEGGSFKPDLFVALPKSKLVPGSEMCFTGPRAFKTRFDPKLSDALMVQYALEGTAGRYRINGDEVDLIRIRFQGRHDTLASLDSYLASRRDYPILQSEETLKYNTVIEGDRSETYIAESGSILYMMIGSTGNQGQQFFEYILRGGR